VEVVERMKYKALIFAAIYVALIVLSIGITAALVKIVCWAFGITFMWRYAIGVWALICLLGSVFKNGSKS
jgi:hypothetical protein